MHFHERISGTLQGLDVRLGWGKARAPPSPQELPGAPRGSMGLPGVPWGSLGLHGVPKEAKSQELHEVPRKSQGLGGGAEAVFAGAYEGRRRKKEEEEEGREKRKRREKEEEREHLILPREE